MDSRSGSDSRCSSPSGAPYRWEYLRDCEHPAVAELYDWLGMLYFTERERQLGIIDSLFEDSELGLLWDNADDPHERIKPVWTDPDVYEIRHQVMSQHLRFYHAEPESNPKLLLSLHQHMKPGLQSAQEAIDEAVGIYRAPGS